MVNFALHKKELDAVIDSPSIVSPAEHSVIPNTLANTTHQSLTQHVL